VNHRNFPWGWGVKLTGMDWKNAAFAQLIIIKIKTANKGMDWKNALNGGPGGGPPFTIIVCEEVRGMNADGNQDQYGREERQDHRVLNPR
jgi:hypothetical protein